MPFGNYRFFKLFYKNVTLRMKNRIFFLSEKFRDSIPLGISNH